MPLKGFSVYQDQTHPQVTLFIIVINLASASIKLHFKWQMTTAIMALYHKIDKSIVRMIYTASQTINNKTKDFEKSIKLSLAKINKT